MSLSSIVWSGSGRKFDINSFKETTILEPILNLLAKEDLLKLPINYGFKSTEEELKHYKVGVFNIYNGSVKSVMCYRTKANNKLQYINNFNKDRFVVIECYEYKDNLYELRRIDLDTYLRFQGVEIDDELPPETMLACEEWLKYKNPQSNIWGFFLY